MKKQISPVKGTPAVPRFQFVETGLYRNTSNGVYFERPSIKGRRIWRSLDTANLKHAREELYRRRAGVRAVEVEKAKAAVTVGEIGRHYQKNGYPDRQKQPRTGRTLENGNAKMFRPVEVLGQSSGDGYLPRSVRPLPRVAAEARHERTRRPGCGHGNEHFEQCRPLGHPSSTFSK